MNPAETLELAKEAGLTLPSPAWIFGCILFSLIGFAAWRYGKFVQRPRIRWLGLALHLERSGDGYTARFNLLA